MKRPSILPTLRRKVVALDDLRAAFESATDELAQAEAALVALTDDAAAADQLDAAIRLGEIEPTTAHEAQKAARDALSAGLSRRDRLIGETEALRLRCLEQARADVEAQTAAGRAQTAAAAADVAQAADELQEAQVRHAQAQDAEREIAATVRRNPQGALPGLPDPHP